MEAKRFYAGQRVRHTSHTLEGGPVFGTVTRFMDKAGGMYAGTYRVVWDSGVPEFVPPDELIHADKLDADAIEKARGWLEHGVREYEGLIRDADEEKQREWIAVSKPHQALAIFESLVVKAALMDELEERCFDAGGRAPFAEVFSEVCG